MTRIGKNWQRMAAIYRLFSEMDESPLMSSHALAYVRAYNDNRDFSESAMLDAYRRETFGEDVSIRRPDGKINGYIEGKQWMDLTVTDYWLPDLQSRELIAIDLWRDEKYPTWFLRKVLPARYHLADDVVSRLRA